MAAMAVTGAVTGDIAMARGTTRRLCPWGLFLERTRMTADIADGIVSLAPLQLLLELWRSIICEYRAIGGIGAGSRWISRVGPLLGSSIQ